MSHFNLKTLSFYAVAISSVLFLFKVVSTYGETKLNAAADINGRYQFASVENLPNCLQGKQLNLNIEQSGVYLYGNLAVQAQAKPKSVVKIPLSGDFEDNQVIMSGQGNLSGCDAGLQLAIQGQREQQNLVGQIKDATAQTESSFVATYQEPEPEPVEGH